MRLKEKVTIRATIGVIVPLKGLRGFASAPTYLILGRPGNQETFSEIALTNSRSACATTIHSYSPITHSLMISEINGMLGNSRSSFHAIG